MLDTSDVILDKTIVLPPFRAHQLPRQYTIASEAKGIARQMTINAQTHDASWKRPGDGDGSAVLRFSTHAVADATLSLDITESWSKGANSAKTTERSTTVTLPSEVARELYAWLKGSFEPNAPISEAAAE